MILRNRFVWPPLAVLALAVAAAQIPIPAWTISPDDRPALARAYRAITGREADPRYVCGRAVRGFSDVVVIGGFAHDRGCAVIGVAVASRPFELAHGTPVGLARAGWATAPPPERARLALAWTSGVLLAFRTALDTAPEAFARPGAPAFANPAATPLPDGGVRVELWVQEPAGMLPQFAFTRVAFTFARDGSAGRAERLDAFQVPMRP